MNPEGWPTDLPKAPTCECCGHVVTLAWLESPEFTDAGPQCQKCRSDKNPGKIAEPVSSTVLELMAQEISLMREFEPRKEPDLEKFPEVKDIPNNTFISKVVLGQNNPTGDETQ